MDTNKTSATDAATKGERDGFPSRTKKERTFPVLPSTRPGRGGLRIDYEDDDENEDEIGRRDPAQKAGN